MAGGLLQLVAYGAQDIYLTGNPQITFFKVVYRRHTNFSLESIENVFNGIARFGNRVTCQISRNGDLINRMYLVTTLPQLDPVEDLENSGIAQAQWVKSVGLRLIQNVLIEIGGQQIDKHYSEWMYIWNELSLPAGKRAGYDKMVGNTPGASATLPGTPLPAPKAELSPDYQDGPTDFTYVVINQTLGTASLSRSDPGNGNILAGAGTTVVTDNRVIIGKFATYNAARAALVDAGDIILKVPVLNRESDGVAAVPTPATKINVPLEFWFCRNVGLALPLIALQYHEVKVNIDFETLSNCLTNSNYSNKPELGDASLWVDYIYLDTDERRRFAQLSHEYLIEQLQFTGDEQLESNNARLKLNFNHPVKELVWVTKADANSWVDFSNGSGANPMTHGLLQLNGQDRFMERTSEYFDTVQPYQHHENVPVNSPGINVYSFALKPEEHQPSGSLNFSRIDTAYLSMKMSSSASSVVKVFAVNYNVLRIMSGMGGLAYSN
jgi:hypothetical protein